MSAGNWVVRKAVTWAAMWGCAQEKGSLWEPEWEFGWVRREPEWESGWVMLETGWVREKASFG